MGLNMDAVGDTTDTIERSWTSSEALLYALSTGAGQWGPEEELSLTTENSTDVAQQVLPTFAVLVARPVPGPAIGGYDPALAVHAEQAFTLRRPLNPAGAVRVRSTVVDIQDKRSGALVTVETTAAEPGSDEPLIIARSGTFIRGAGGFGGRGETRARWAEPGREPDHGLVYRTRPEQALLYRLTGDRNPLHSDPVFAARVGFPRPIMHGLCTYGITGRLLLHAVAGSDPARLTSMSGRFTSPVLPGDLLTVSMWEDGPAIRFRTTKSDGTVAIDRGTATVVPG